MFLFYYLQDKLDCHINMENREILRPSFLQFGIYWEKIKENICFIVEMTVYEMQMQTISNVGITFN